MAEEATSKEGGGEASPVLRQLGTKRDQKEGIIVSVLSMIMDDVVWPWRRQRGKGTQGRVQG
jgi:hypothetical protein